MPFGLKAPQCAAQTREAATHPRGKCTTAWLTRGSRHHLLVRNTSTEDDVLFIIAAFPCIGSPTTLIWNSSQNSRSQSCPWPECSEGSVHHCQMWYAKFACPCPWEHPKQLLHPPSRWGCGAPQTDWSWCPFQRCSSCPPHTGSSRCCTLHALAVCPRMSWRPPRLFPGTLKTQKRSGVSTTGVLLWHKWPGCYCPSVVGLSAH